MPREKRQAPAAKPSARQEFKEIRRRRQRNQRIIVLCVIGAIVLVLGAAVVEPIYRSLTATQIPLPAVVIPPEAPRPLAQNNAMGDPNAPVKIEAFSDFQCPACKSFYEGTEAQIVDAYVATGKVYFIYRTMDIWIGPESRDAGEAAYCAGEQGKFWEYHDILFANWNGENQGGFRSSRLEELAAALQLDQTAFRSCLSSDKFLKQTKEDRAIGDAYGVTATPSFIINGQILEGVQPFSVFQEKIEAALAAAGK